LETERNLINIVAERRIAERQKAEEALRKSEANYKTLVKHIQKKIFIKDRNSIYVSCNEAYAGDLKIKPEEIAGKSDYDFYPKEIAKKNITDDKEVINTGKTKDIEEQYFINGEKAWVHTVKAPIRDENGDIIGLLGIFRDITEHKKTEQDLKGLREAMRKDKMALEHKNLALKELIEHMERAREKRKEDIAINVEKVIMPILKKMKLKGLSSKYVDLLCHYLSELTSSFGRKMTEKNVGLSSREIEICNLIKGNLSSKEISRLLNLSCQTIDKHRRNIRKKLGISKEKINLISFLQNL
jgi:PAS domain S-box-containing protein